MSRNQTVTSRHAVVVHATLVVIGTHQHIQTGAGQVNPNAGEGPPASRVPPRKIDRQKTRRAKRKPTNLAGVQMPPADAAPKSTEVMNTKTTVSRLESEKDRFHTALA
ncbi:MAG: hypothetical protein GY758_16655 [Fuerstiella sp.]|nr:hypothetical protein [Fuerstiella sp.]MCP4505541.1 hypothetical protein [Fuerstiella sp.]MDG2130488.1 hypothetical protein [Fuerstiella sp.]